MLRRIVALFMGVSVAGLLGCVSADSYHLKEQEAASLSDANKDMQERNKYLRAEKSGLESRVEDMKKENAGLAAALEKRNSEIEILKGWGETLEKDGEALRARLDKMTLKIAEMTRENQRLAALTLPENLVKTLGDYVAELEKQVEALSVENDKLRYKHAGFRPLENEKRTDLASEKIQRVIVPPAEKDKDSEPQKQAVMLSPGQKDDDSGPEPQQNKTSSRENWRKRAAQAGE